MRYLITEYHARCAFADQALKPCAGALYSTRSEIARIKLPGGCRGGDFGSHFWRLIFVSRSQSRPDGKRFDPGGCDFGHAHENYSQREAGQSAELLFHRAISPQSIAVLKL